ncbi:peptidoglycan-binding domain-containing protein [Paeniglutamicibacter sp. R2-26]|uniref:peptidoglycan-binding domain-containing protein n=1 Tax=Paeniglutamicibacter sp. R2-26 TaxID=3144417 RepID=UPI003EE4BEBA
MGARARSTNTNKPWTKYLATGLGIGLAAGAGGWAVGATLVGGSAAAQEADQSVWVQAKESSIGSSLNLSTSVKQPVKTVASNHLSGVVSAVSPGELKPGDELYSVAGVEVYVIEGKTPFYQDITPKSSGQNVKQVESFLKSQDHFQGAPDTTFDAATTRGIKAWQAATGQKPDGTIPLGRMVAIPALPAQVELAETITPGRQLAGGEDAVLAASGQRTFTMSLTAEQAALIPQDSIVEITHEKSTWPATIAQTTTDDSGNLTHTLTAPDGGEVCAGQCRDLPSGSNLTLRSKVIVVPATTGTGIPAAAITTTATGQAQVTTESGTTDIKIVASGQGIAIVEGLEPGTTVQVLGAPDGAP